jgi:hypothetical protein
MGESVSAYCVECRFVVRDSWLFQAFLVLPLRKYTLALWALIDAGHSRLGRSVSQTVNTSMLSYLWEGK